MTDIGLGYYVAFGLEIIIAVRLIVSLVHIVWFALRIST